MSRYFRPPVLSWRFVSVWRRNFLVWRKLAIPALLGNLADPAFYMLGLGYGLGGLLPEVNGASYIAFLAAGTLCYSTMNSASFEALYSGFSRMHVQKTWEAILNTPLILDDVLLGELVWTITKSLMSGLAILIIIWVMGLYSSFALSLWAIPVIILMGFCFTGMALVVNAVSPSYDFFMYYFTLAVTPMVLLGGVFYPVDQLPPFLQQASAALPLTHAIELVRPLMLGRVPSGIVKHILVLAAYGGFGYYLALALTRRRLLK
ncbi:MAG: ABC transporter permease [Burkholderiales bacterium]